MPAISITDDQRERLRWIQTRLAEDVEYGHVRPRDALEYLLDRVDEDDDAVAQPAESGEASTSDSPSSTGSPPTSESIPPSTGTADDSTEFVVMNGEGGVTGRHTSLGGTDPVDEGDDGGMQDGDDAADDRSTTDDEGTDVEEMDDEATDDEEMDDESQSEVDAADGNPTDDADDPADAGDTDDAESGDGERLNAVMSLLADHDGKWRETGGGEEKYEVDLPDGGTERARTKDDVRAVLFKHYR